MNADLAAGVSAQLAAEVAAQLAALESARAQARRPADVTPIREELLRVVTLWRRLLDAHQPANGDGRCPRCRK